MLGGKSDNEREVGSTFLLPHGLECATGQTPLIAAQRGLYAELQILFPLGSLALLRRYSGLLKNKLFRNVGQVNGC